MTDTLTAPTTRNQIVDARTFQFALKRVLFATEREAEGRYVRPTLWHVYADGTSLVAADGFRLASVPFPLGLSFFLHYSDAQQVLKIPNGPLGITAGRAGEGKTTRPTLTFTWADGAETKEHVCTADDFTFPNIERIKADNTYADSLRLSFRRQDFLTALDTIFERKKPSAWTPARAHDDLPKAVMTLAWDFQDYATLSRGDRYARVTVKSRDNRAPRPMPIFQVNLNGYHIGQMLRVLPDKAAVVASLTNHKQAVTFTTPAVPGWYSINMPCTATGR